MDLYDLATSLIERLNSGTLGGQMSEAYNCRKLLKMEIEKGHKDEFYAVYHRLCEAIYSYNWRHADAKLAQKLVTISEDVLKEKMDRMESLKKDLSATKKRARNDHALSERVELLRNDLNNFKNRIKIHRKRLKWEKDFLDLKQQVYDMKKPKTDTSFMFLKFGIRDE